MDAAESHAYSARVRLMIVPTSFERIHALTAANILLVRVERNRTGRKRGCIDSNGYRHESRILSGAERSQDRDPAYRPPLPERNRMSSPTSRCTSRSRIMQV